MTFKPWNQRAGLVLIALLCVGCVAGTSYAWWAQWESRGAWPEAAPSRPGSLPTATAANEKPAPASYTEFMRSVKAGEVSQAKVTETDGALRRLEYAAKGGQYSAWVPVNGSWVDALVNADVGLQLREEVPNQVTGLMDLARWSVLWIASVFLLVLALHTGARVWRQRNGQAGAMATGWRGALGMRMEGAAASAEVGDPRGSVTFADVAGCDEAKAEVSELVDFLRYPERFTALGARMPRGVLLSGPAGTGKTLLAKAIANEAGVPFFSAAGSTFVEVYVGQGAKNIRRLFAKAHQHAPCIVFIDEIDAVGGKRSPGGRVGGHEEREQTLNQLLVEMDGFATNSKVIVLAATNRPDMLDDALLRPGRFDRQVVVNLPDLRGREQILRTHATKVPLGSDVDLRSVACGTPGFSGAELANLINEAAIFASRAGKVMLNADDFGRARDKVMMGAERSLAMPEKERRITAYHEAGHAVLAALLPNTDPLHKVTIIPRGRALGLTMQLPQHDRYGHQQAELQSQLAVLFGGRISEQMFLGDISTGASNDLERATKLARKMVTRWGMSRLGPMVLEERGNGDTTVSSETLREADAEVKALLAQEYQRAAEMLQMHRGLVETMALALLELETLEDWQLLNILEGRPVGANAPAVATLAKVASAGAAAPRERPTTFQPARENRAPDGRMPVAA